MVSWKAVELVTIVNILGPCRLSAIYFKSFPGGIAFIYESLYAVKLKANGIMRPSYKTRWNPSKEHLIFTYVASSHAIHWSKKELVFT